MSEDADTLGEKINLHHRVGFVEILLFILLQISPFTCNKLARVNPGICDPGLIE